ncbi:iron-sulfur cluster assembly protein SufB [Klebsiella pneumoniae subsp. ozaenae]|uniref:Iron-sulfur cluster assembly protein SufB n=1 Tax=Klebsiella pneumoniae subsp. ozaenae TaxID=574 RepID=A0A377ZJA9_KLEPO|nr:iron-sulfur cluster assembly protein SufB [Klebsiella pneumoniae subsp. ozaenae]
MALTSGHQQADTGTKMIHIGKNTRSTIISKGISAGHSQNSYRGLVKIMPTATNARNYTQCDSMLIGPDCGAHTFPYVECRNNSAQLEHEATTFADWRRSIVLLPAARDQRRRCHLDDRQRFL